MSNQDLVQHVYDVFVMTDQRWGEYYPTLEELGNVISYLTQKVSEQPPGTVIDYGGVTVRHDDDGDIEVYVKVGNAG